MFKKGLKYMSKHPTFNGSLHAIGGIGVGIIIASPIIGTHPVRWGIALMAIAALGHVYAFMQA